MKKFIKVVLYIVLALVIILGCGIGYKAGQLSRTVVSVAASGRIRRLIVNSSRFKSSGIHKHSVSSTVRNQYRIVWRDSVEVAATKRTRCFPIVIQKPNDPLALGRLLRAFP